MHKNKAIKQNQSAVKILIKDIMKTVLITFVITVCLLFFFSFILQKCENPTKDIKLFGYTLFFISALILGFVSSRVRKFSVCVFGAICGICFALLIFLISLFFENSGLKSFSALLSYIIYIAVCSLSALIFSKAKRKKGFY